MIPVSLYWPAIRLSHYIRRLHAEKAWKPAADRRKNRQQILQEAFFTVRDLLETSGLPYWIDYGTLLGWQRCGGILPHDNDVDFSLRATDAAAVRSFLEPRLPRGYRFYDRSWAHFGPKFFLNVRGFDVDLYFFQEEDGFFQNVENSPWPNEIQKIPAALLFPLQKSVFLGKEVPVPADPQGYLTLLYGYTGPGGRRDAKTGLWSAP